MKPKDLRVLTQLQKVVNNRVINLHIGERVFGPAVDTLNLFTCDCCLRVICILVTALLHELIQTVVADLNGTHVSTMSDVN